MSTAPEPRRLVPLASTAAQVAEDALTLLRKARVQVAIRQLERLPELFRAELTDAAGAADWAGYQRGYRVGAAEAYQAGYAEGQRALLLAFRRSRAALLAEATARRPRRGMPVQSLQPPKPIPVRAIFANEKE
jgi:flagellar biosynthesis/type III secretory pathway protein FliH